MKYSCNSVVISCTKYGTNYYYIPCQDPQPDPQAKDRLLEDCQTSSAKGRSPKANCSTPTKSSRSKNWGRFSRCMIGTTLATFRAGLWNSSWEDWETTSMRKKWTPFWKKWTRTKTGQSTFNSSCCTCWRRWMPRIWWTTSSRYSRYWIRTTPAISPQAT